MLPSWWAMLTVALLFGGLMFLQGRRMLGAIDERITAATDRGKAERLTKEGCLAFQAGQFDEARSLFAAARERFWALDDFAATVGLAILMARVNRAEGTQSQGIALLRKSLSTLPPEAGEPLRHQLFAELGILMSDQGDFPQAVTLSPPQVRASESHLSESSP